MKDTNEYEYTVSSFNVWTSFDYGTVQARNQIEAKKKAIAKLKEDFEKANEAFNHCDNTKGFSVEFDTQNVEVKLKNR
jgi:hypothetical protein